MADERFSATVTENANREVHANGSTSVPTQTVLTMEVGELLCLGDISTVVLECDEDMEVSGTSNCEIFVFESGGSEGEELYRLGMVLDRVGVEENTSICVAAGWEEPTPLFSLHPSNCLDVWVLHKAKEIQQCVGIVCDGFENQFIVLLEAIEAGKKHSASPGELA